MKKQNSRLLTSDLRVIVWFSLLIGGAAASSNADDIFKDNNNTALSTGSSWVGGVVPTLTGTAVWDSRVSAGNTVNTWSSGGLSWGQITILNPGADVQISSSVSSSRQLIHGIDMSQATRDLTFEVTAVTPWQTYLKNAITIAANRTLNLNNPGTIQFGTLSFSGPGTLVASHNIKLFDAGAVLTISSGTLQANDGLDIGWQGAATVNQGGGTVNVAAKPLYINNNGVYNLAGGALNLGVEARIGQSVVGGNSALNVSGGGLTQTDGLFYVGYGSGRGQYVQSGNSAVSVNTLRIENGSLTVNGGTFSANSFLVLSQANNSDTRITLAGGTTTLPAFPTIHGSGAYTDITFDGGTLRPAAASTTYMQGLNKAYLTGNGAILDVASGRNITIAQILENASGHNGKLTKIGAGTLTLSSANTYSGHTVIDGGVLALATAGDNNIAGSSVIRIGAGATLNVSGVTGSGGFKLAGGQTLKGTGTLAGNMTVLNGAAVAPGNSPGLLTINGNQIWNNGGIYQWEVQNPDAAAGVGYDTIDVNGTLNFTAVTPGGVALQLSPYALSSEVLLSHVFALWTYDLLTGWDAAVNGASSLFTLTGFGGVDTSSAYVYNDGSGTIWLTGMSAVPLIIPEPGTLGLFTLAFIIIGATRRRMAGRR